MRRDSSCYHCGLPAPEGQRYEVEIDGIARAMCCPACQAVAEIITAGGFGQYYQYRTENSERPEAEQEFAAFDTPAFQESFVSEEKDGSASVLLLVGGIHCAACVWLIEHYLRRLPGVLAIRVSLNEQQASVCWQPEQLKLSEICAAIAAIGYEAQPFTHNQLEKLRDAEQRQALRRLGVAGIGMMQVGMYAIALYAGDMQDIATEYRSLLRWVSLLLATVIVFYAARPFFSGAWRGLKTRSPGMDLPIAIAIGLAYTASVHATVTGRGEVYFDSVCMFTFFLLCGRYLEMRARHRSGRVTADVLSLLPASVLRATPNETYEAIAAATIGHGDILLVKSGQVIPADGSVVSGASSVNEAALTGEFMPVTKQYGDSVSAGAINGENPLTIRVEAVGKNMRISRIKQLLERAQDEKPRVEELAQRIALWFVIAVLSVATVVWIFWHFKQADLALAITLSVLVVSCPCALSLATPTAITAATNALRQRGLLVTRRAVWETLPRLKHVIFDKTGTLTQGRLKVEEVDVVGNFDKQHCLGIAAALERGSSHPIATAFVGYDTGLPVSSLHSEMGQGVQGVVDGELYRLGGVSYAAGIYSAAAAERAQNCILLANQHGLLARFKLRDELRPEAAAVIRQLQDNNLSVHLLSGDASGAAAEVAAQLGIAHVVEGAQPQDKLDYIRTLQGKTREKVMMVGDGINDIPVLAAADVSLAMLDASDLAKTSADCILLTPSLATLPALFDKANDTSKIIRQNLLWALLYNASAIPLAALGFVPPYLAAIGMSTSSIFVVVNSLRLWPRQKQQQISPLEPVIPAQAGI